MGNEVIGPFGQDDLFRFSMGLVALLIAIGVLAILAALLTRALFDLRVRAVANRRGFEQWSAPLPDPATSLLKRQLFAESEEKFPVLPGHLAALHPQRLAAQVANRLQAIAEADLPMMLYFLEDIDGLRVRDPKPSRTGMSSDPGSDVSADATARGSVEERLAHDTAVRRGTAARIDSAVDALQMRLVRETMLWGYLVALLSSLLISGLAYASLEIPLRISYVLYALLAALFAAFVAALLHNRFDQPKIV